MKGYFIYKESTYAFQETEQLFYVHFNQNDSKYQFESILQSMCRKYTLRDSEKLR